MEISALLATPFAPVAIPLCFWFLSLLTARKLRVKSQKNVLSALTFLLTITLVIAFIVLHLYIRYGGAAFPRFCRSTILSIAIALFSAVIIFAAACSSYIRDRLSLDDMGRVVFSASLIPIGALITFHIIRLYTPIYVPQPVQEPENPAPVFVEFRENIPNDTLTLSLRNADSDESETYDFQLTRIKKTKNGAKIIAEYTNYDGANEPRYTVKLTLDGDLEPGERYRNAKRNLIQIDFNRRGAEKYRVDDGAEEGRYDFALTYRNETWDRYQGTLSAIVQRRVWLWYRDGTYYLDNGVFDFSVPSKKEKGDSQSLPVPVMIPVDSYRLGERNSAYDNPNYIGPYFYRYDSDNIAIEELREADYSYEQTQYFINEMYARHACNFNRADMNNAFEAKFWFFEVTGRTSVNPERTRSVAEAGFNAYERANQNVFAEYRAERKKIEGR